MSQMCYTQECPAEDALTEDICHACQDPVRRAVFRTTVDIQNAAACEPDVVG